MNAYSNDIVRHSIAARIEGRDQRGGLCHRSHSRLPRIFGERLKKHMAAGIGFGLLLLASPAVAGQCQAPLDPFSNPFSKASAYHRPIGSGAAFAGDSDPTTLNLKHASFSNINSNNGWGINVYKSVSSDPYLTVTHNGQYNSGLPVSLHVPSGSQNMNTTDAVIVIYDSARNIAHEFFYWRWNNGRPTASIHRQWDIRATGHSKPGWSAVGVSASGVAGMFGLLRGDEVNVPGYKIQHALQMALDGQGKCGMMLKNQVVWPAATTDGFCKSNPGLCTGKIPYGALLALPSGVNIDSLGLSEPGKRLAEALQNYGVYVVDNSQCPTMRGDQYISSGVKQALINDMRKVYPHLRMVLNNNATQTTAGGGTGRAANCAFDSPSR